MTFTNEIEINAPASAVWRLTLDIERWPELTSTVTAARRLDEGEVGVGSQAELRQPGMPRAVWTVTELEPERRFVWSTKIATVTFEGRHEIEPTDSGCRNRLYLEVSGPGSSVLARLSRKRLEQALATENAGFKKAAEAAEEGGGATDS